MSTAGRFRSSATRLIHRLGDHSAVTLRRRHTLKTQRGGGPTNSLLVNGAHTAGASTLVLRAAGTLLEGTFPKGCAVTVSGTAYTASADATAASNLVTLTVTPVLAGNLTDATAATVTTTYADHTFYALRSGQSLENIETGELATRRVLHLAYRSDITPATTDHIVVDSAQRGVVSVELVNPGAGVTHTRVVVGGAA
jgi:hypothetical protein